MKTLSTEVFKTNLLILSYLVRSYTRLNAVWKGWIKKNYLYMEMEKNIQQTRSSEKNIWERIVVLNRAAGL